jgi:hypothetical protein
LKAQLDWSKLDEKVSTTSSQINYFDDDEDLNFINSNKNLLNTTEQTIYIVCQLIFIYKKNIFSFVIYSKNDHQYYNVSYIIPKSERISSYFIEDNNQFIRIHALSDRHRSAFVNEYLFNHFQIFFFS